MKNCVSGVLNKVILSLCIAMSVSLLGCRPSSTPRESESTVSPDTTAPHIQAFEMMREGKPYEEYMEKQRVAVKQLREGHPRSDAIAILSQTGHMLMRHGDYEEALLYLQEASDSVQKREDAGRLDDSMIQMRNNIAIVYAHFGLNEEALAENSKAIEISKKLNHAYYSDLWRMRGAMYNVQLQDAENKSMITDSILYCLQRAYEAIPMMPKEYQGIYADRCNFDRVALYVENHFLFPEDSIQSAIQLLRSIKNPKSTDSKDVLLGRAYVLTGNADEGITLMEKGLDNFRTQDWKESVDWTLDLLAQSYAETNRGNSLVRIYPEVRNYSRQLLNETKVNAIIGNDFRYRLREKQQEVKSLQEKNHRYHSVILLCISAAVIGMVTGVILAITYMRLRNRANRDKEKYQNEIDEILSQHVALNSRIEQLNEQLESRERADVIENVTLQLDPSLLSGEDEIKFRKAFMTLHPKFLPSLRRDFPMLTAADELLCMLIYLKVPPLDMAAALGISRASLNSARYRVRKRLNLDKDTSLDSFIESIA